MGSDEHDNDKYPFTRRGFLRASGAAVAGGALASCGAPRPEPEIPAEPPTASPGNDSPEPIEGTIKRHRTLGRTGFAVSDIGMGCGRITDANVVRYAYDHGVNYFDVAETYGNGDSERKIGEAMPHLDRSRIFVTTKLKIKDEDTEQTLLDRFGRCLERLSTDYVDALYMHAVNRVELVAHEGFHSAVGKLKADGRLRHAGISSHGPRDEGDARMSEVLLAAVAEGRFDLMLMVYNFMKAEEGEQVLAACKEKNVGTTSMKAYAGQLAIEPFDPDDPSEDYARSIKILVGRGKTREEAVAHIQKRLEARMAEMAEHKPVVDAFVAQHGVANQLDLDQASIQWALGNPDLHTVCVAMPDFDRAAQILPLSGTELSAAGELLLRDYARAFGNRYCRHGCDACLASCPRGVPVSTVMRYAYYYNHGGRERYAMERYARLSERCGEACIECDAPCERACPHGVAVQASLTRVHAMLTLA
jgi:predicted aldo/keto reductase-like oxidoreductase